MILYFASYKNSEEIETAVAENKKAVMDKKVVADFDFSLFLKQQMDSLKAVDVLIVDLQALSNTDDEILISLRNFRMLYEKAKVIIIASNRERGDRLLSELFCLGIYDIIAGDLEKEILKEEISYSIVSGKSLRESLIYKDEYVPEEDKTVPVREKIVIKNEIRPAVNKALIGFMGTQSRIGTTHNAIVCANYLKNKGFKIAIVEVKECEYYSFEEIRDNFEINEPGEVFNLNLIDYYPAFDMINISKILTRNYNFVLLDFGSFSLEKVTEFNRCVISIIVAGSKPWEIKKINRIFESMSAEDLKEYTYLFNFTDPEDQKNIEGAMGDLKKVFFCDYEADPFNTIGYAELDELFKGYVPETIIKTKNNGVSLWGGIIEKCGKIFSK